MITSDLREYKRKPAKEESLDNGDISAQLRSRREASKDAIFTKYTISNGWWLRDPTVGRVAFNEIA